MVTKCFNHPTQAALSSCHVCKNHYCAECLTEGVEYYYCQKEECRRAYDAEQLTLDIDCPNCGSWLELNENAKRARSFKCPGCRKKIDLNKEPVTLVLGAGAVVHNPANHELCEQLQAHSQERNFAARLYVYYNTMIEAVADSDHNMILRYHYEQDEDYYQATREDLTIDEIKEAFISFRNCAHHWKSHFEWNSFAVADEFIAEKKSSRIKRRMAMVIFIVAAFIVPQIIMGVLKWLYEYFHRK